MTFTDVKDARHAQQIPVDHVVALGVAHRYGARDWTPAQRLAFATDLRNLVPTSRSVNSAKRDRDPAAWKPAQGHQCLYAERYITIKKRYELPVDWWEKRALTEMLQAC